MTLTVSSPMEDVSSFLPDDPAIDQLRLLMQGTVLLPGDATFAEAAQTWIIGFVHQPALIVLPETATDVVAAMQFANDHALPVSIQGSGHGPTTPNIGGMLINTSRMQGVMIDPERRIARVEAGVKWRPVIEAAHQAGLAPLSGSSSDVGVVGYSLGGGMGWLVRKYGFAADAILAADLVTATGELIRVSAGEHPDLFWALRGGGGNFGVVVALEFELFPVSTLFGGAVFYPLAEAPEVFRRYADWTATAPVEISSAVLLMRFPPIPALPEPLRGQSFVVIQAAALGAEGEELAAPLRMMGTPVLDTFTEFPYDQIDRVSSDPVDPMPMLATGFLLKDLSAETISALMGVAGPDADCPFLSVQVRHIGGMAAEESLAHSAANPNEAPFVCYALGVPMGPESAAAIAAGISELRQQLAPFMADKTPLNFHEERGIGAARGAFRDDHYQRLQQVKAVYDPQNRFRFNLNIPPAE